MNDQQLFEIAAKLRNLRPDQLRLKKRYLDVVVIETLDGAKYTYFVTELEAITMDGFAVVSPPPPAPPPQGEGSEVEASPKPQHTRKR
jgi:hypothetical protein